VKNRIYTSLLFGISLAFSVSGHTQTKPTNKQTASKAITTSASRSKQTKSADKKPTTEKTKPKNKKSPDSIKAANKAASKLAAEKKSVPASKTNNKKQGVVSTKIKNTKQSIAAIKVAEKKQSSKTKNKQSTVLAKSDHKAKKLASPDTSARKHTVISSKSIASTPLKFVNYRELERGESTDLDMHNTKSSMIADLNSERNFHPLSIDQPQPTKVNTAHVSIETSLFLDGLEAGLSKELILQLTEIFAWDIDFATNLRPGDEFTIVYGKKIVNGKETDTDEIIAAEFVNQGTSYTALRYIDESGATSYYTPDGQSMQRAFLSAPVDFIKISSPFDPHRKHPILNRIRAHKGIDYAARIGTPVKTTGDGIVTFCGRNGAYGQVVVIQHNDHYETLYAHMSGFRKGLSAGEHVKQGDVIGYVGQTGLATGPHLHYEFHVDGVYRDPETVKIPHSMPISSRLLADFKAQTQVFFVQLTQAKSTSLLAKTPPAINPGVTNPSLAPQPSNYD
jgi:murein DD-endopeptidase MepM/ murein hydrolase activator NlpD